MYVPVRDVNSCNVVHVQAKYMKVTCTSSHVGVGGFRVKFSGANKRLSVGEEFKTLV